jgi:hypothetical protein
MKAAVLALAALVAALPVRAEQEAELCYNYGCTTKAAVRFSADDLKRVQEVFGDVADAAAERRAIASAMAVFYSAAAAQTPVWRDRGGNLDDDAVEGRMDCIDHSTNTTTWLRLLDGRGWLKYHAVGERIRRGRFIFEHWSARIVEFGSRDEYAVDTWFLDPGRPATIFSLPEWQGGAYPPGTEPVRWH